MIAALHAAALIAAVAQAGTTLPLGYHERAYGGWTLLAVSVPIADYTVCLMDRPPGDALPPGDDVLGTLVAGHAVERVDGASPGRLVRYLLSHRAAPGAHDRSMPIVDRHLLALAGVRWGALGADSTAEEAGAPVLLLAGREDPAELMEMLLRAAGELPPVPAPAGERTREARLPATGWWRHVDTDGPSAVAIGLVVPSAGPELSLAARVALRGVAERLRAVWAGMTTREVRTGGGRIVRFEWAMPADSTPVVYEGALEALATLRRSSMDLRTFERLRAAVVAGDREAIRNPSDRWFAALLAAQLGGARLRTAYDSGRVWTRVTQESVREAARTILPHGVIVVTAGVPPNETVGRAPVERWPVADAVYVEALSPDARATLARRALARTAHGLFGGEPPPAVTVESDWILVRDDGPLTGRLIETLRFPDAIRRDFYPAGPDLVFSTWLVADSLRAAIQGAPRDTMPGERGRLLDRRTADPWNAVRAASSVLERLAYDGAVHAEGAVYQGLTVPFEAHSLRLWLHPETGLPARVFIDRGGSQVTRQYRFDGYVDGGGYRYPGRIERHVGARREAVLTVRSCAPATRVAAEGRLQ